MNVVYYVLIRVENTMEKNNGNRINISFLGAAETVTGSKILVSALGKNILIDCGLFQGLKELRLLNWEPLPTDVSKIDIVLLTHGHLDHVGYLPRLVKAGFKGEIIASEPTLRIAEIILRDSAKIQEEDAARANKYAYTKHKPALPLYSITDVETTLTLFKNQDLNEWVSIDEKISYRFRYNGHIIGATFIELKISDKTLVFSGDIGREKDPLLFPTEKPDKADLLFIESTYGDRLHSEEDPLSTLLKNIEYSLNKKSTVIIPSFSVERSQVLMYLFWQLRKLGKIPEETPIYIDSPMANRVLNIFLNYTDWHKLSKDDCAKMAKHIKCIESVEETYTLAKNKKSKIIIAGSGMATGGRVLTYFEKYLSDKSATIMLVGFQAEGTRGRALLDGVESIKFHGKYHRVKANITSIDSLSAHADQFGLVNWLEKIETKPEKIFIVHGEANAAKSLQSMIKKVYDFDSHIPKLNESISVDI
jgi:metallo-beta-lactamase family protein